MAWQKYDSTYKPGQTSQYKISRSKIDFFLECPRCFWLDRRLGIKRTSIPSFLINQAIDDLLKKEFDAYRTKGEPHPYMVAAGIDAVPFVDKRLDDWRHVFTGVQYLHAPTNLLIFGAVDDLWVRPDGEVIVVDYKATAKDKEIKDLDPSPGWHDAYRKQMEIYQWLVRHNDLKVSDTGYFVYANGDASQPAFDEVVKFRVNTFPYTGDSSWVDQTIVDLKACLEGEIPEVGKGPLGQGCEFCAYARSRTELTLKAIQAKKKSA
jgi:CRISPR/Cas system-associated exonuclease Cas4 (RecB family)